ncbi:MAG: molybdenum cofactor guanylyltransferase [Jatrophihabitantaceae bacterium]
MFDAIVLAGGAARRMQGVDKPALDVGGSTLLDHAVAAVAGASLTVVVGPPRAVSREVIWRREEPVGGGPVAALAAAIGSVRADVVVVLAADLPAIAPAVPVLVDALAAPGDVACLVDAGGRVNHLAAAWRTSSLRDALARIGDPDGAPARALVAAVDMIELPDLDGWGRDCDTWDELAAARARQPSSITGSTSRECR